MHKLMSCCVVYSSSSPFQVFIRLPASVVGQHTDVLFDHSRLSTAKSPNRVSQFAQSGVFVANVRLVVYLHSVRIKCMVFNTGTGTCINHNRCGVL